MACIEELARSAKTTSRGTSCAVKPDVSPISSRRPSAVATGVGSKSTSLRVIRRGAEDVADEGVDDPFQGEPLDLRLQPVRCEIVDDRGKERQCQKSQANSPRGLKVRLVAEARMAAEEGAEKCRQGGQRPVPDLRLDVADQGVVDHKNTRSHIIRTSPSMSSCSPILEAMSLQRLKMWELAPVTSRISNADLRHCLGCSAQPCRRKWQLDNEGMSQSREENMGGKEQQDTQGVGVYVDCRVCQHLSTAERIQSMDYRRQH
ncbi:hypothetical protein GE09DRAFT_312964 [Coniochaeta sp. 2T2.1]|nr:hypothetical protein GE09DRAFT_312964 [Coniochaeta sp. 2T2.1]